MVSKPYSKFHVDLGRDLPYAKMIEIINENYLYAMPLTNMLILKSSRDVLRSDDCYNTYICLLRDNICSLLLLFEQSLMITSTSFKIYLCSQRTDKEMSDFFFIHLTFKSVIWVLKKKKKLISQFPQLNFNCLEQKVF